MSSPPRSSLWPRWALCGGAGIATNSPASARRCHGIRRPWCRPADPNPRNLLFDGVRLWLVDWELESRNDYLFDIAIATTEIASTRTLKWLCSPSHWAKPLMPPCARGSAWCATRLFYGCIALDAVTAGDRNEKAAFML